MRATKGYVAGVGTTSALIGAIGCAFAIVSAVVAVHGWPLALSTPSVATLDGRGAAAAGDPFAVARGGVFASASATRAAAHAGVVRLELATSGRSAGGGDGRRGPLAGPPDLAGGQRSTSGASGRAPASGPGASAASPSPGPGSGSAPAPAPAPAPGQPVVGGGGGSGTPPAPSGSGAAASGLGGVVAQGTSGAGTAVTQTGQQLGGAVQGATGRLGVVVGQVSPAAGQVVTQTGQVAGGVVSGAAGAAGQVVAGAGAAVGGLLGGLGRARAR
ncbi:MAG TPA: hypothetical protein VFF79_17910 [Conexibacter sp.]|jgi:hypothetical protein|nr:hypothetical protein [Conexibacter sp.]